MDGMEKNSLEEIMFYFSLKIPPRGHHIFPTSAKKTNIFLEIYKIKAKINDF